LAGRHMEKKGVEATPAQGEGGGGNGGTMRRRGRPMERGGWKRWLTHHDNSDNRWQASLRYTGSLAAARRVTPPATCVQWR
jgi:hypothetical protein